MKDQYYLLSVFIKLSSKAYLFFSITHTFQYLSQAEKEQEEEEEEEKAGSQPVCLKICSAADNCPTNTSLNQEDCTSCICFEYNLEGVITPCYWISSSTMSEPASLALLSFL